MRCPACHQNIRIQGKFCPKCGEQIFGLPVHGAPPDHAAPSDFTPPPPPLTEPLVEPMGAAPEAPEASFTPPPLYPPRPAGPISANDYLLDFPQAGAESNVLEVTLDDSGPEAIKAAGEQFSGKVCPFCRFPIKPGEAVQVCPSCATPHHMECWRENRGCTTYGCQSSPQVGGAQPVTGVAPGMAVAPGGYQAAAYSGDLPRAARALLEQELDRLATNALIFALLWFLCGIPALIGLLTGISVLGQIKQAGLTASGAKKKAWIAIGISSAVLVGGIIWIVNLVAGS